MHIGSMYQNKIYNKRVVGLCATTEYNFGHSHLTSLTEMLVCQELKLSCSLKH